jgi:tetratricopeptide (TPR) repeat protein
VAQEVPRRTTAQDRLPRAIGPYAIRERIGKGAMGVVYRATPDDGRTEVALKVMASDLDGDPETRERFFREAHVAGRLLHRNIVAVRDSGEDNGRLYIAMELLRGATLTDCLKQPESLDLEDRIDMMIQVCQGLTVAHAAGVYHRDLKPANLFVCEDRRVKILDFGVARLVGSNMTVTGNIIGTPDFMSPEQVRGEEIDGRSDIFSAGSVFYLLLTGRKPFAANDLPAVLNKVVRSQPLPIRDNEAPEAIAAVVRKALAKDPAARQQEVGQLACELMAAATAIAKTTRHTAVAVRTMAEGAGRLVSRSRELVSTLQLPPDSAPDPFPALREQYPVLRAGFDAIVSYPARARVVQELHDAVQNEVETLTRQVQQLEDAQAKFTAGTTLARSGSPEQALREFDAARRLVPGSPLIDRAIEASAEEVRKLREREAEIQARLSLAQEAAERAEWETVLTVVSELQEMQAVHPLIARLHDDAVRNLEIQRARQTRGGSGKRPAATSGTSPGAGTRVPRPAPPAPPIDAVPGDADTTLPMIEVTGRAAELRARAIRQLTGGELAKAEVSANEALTLNSADEESRHLLERVRTTITLRARQEENGRRVVELLKRADALAESRQFDKALALCDEALGIEPTHEGAIAARARLADEHETHQADREREAGRQRRLQAAAPALQQARRAFADGDLERARWCAENALALAPDSTDAQALLAEITAAMPAPSADDTVKLGDPQSDETAELAPMQQTVQDRVRSQASSWMRMWRSPDDKTKG